MWKLRWLRNGKRCLKTNLAGADSHAGALEQDRPAGNKSTTRVCPYKPVVA